jgi:hypothetical protein
MTDVSGWRKRQIEQSEMCSNYGGFCKKEWVGLTDEDKQKLAAEHHDWESLYLAVQAKLKEKNT